MDIHEAAKAALESNKCMKRRAWRMASVGVYEFQLFANGAPTSKPCLSYNGDPWTPMPEDIFAEDWEVVEPICDTEPHKVDRSTAQNSKERHKCSKILIAASLISIAAIVISIVALLMR